MSKKEWIVLVVAISLTLGSLYCYAQTITPEQAEAIAMQYNDDITQAAVFQDKMIQDNRGLDEYRKDLVDQQALYDNDESSYNHWMTMANIASGFLNELNQDNSDNQDNAT